MLTPAIFDILEHTAPGRNNEIQLTDGMKELCHREKMCAVDFEGRRYDTGNLKGYLATPFLLAKVVELTGKENEYFLAWTTTPWTLPADDAVILHPEAAYVAVEHDGRAAIFAEALWEKCAAKFGWEDAMLVCDANGETWHASGTDLAGNLYKQPIFGDQGETGVFIYADWYTFQ